MKNMKNMKNMSNKERTIKRTKRTKKISQNILKGGKMLGKGGFGCVITPPIDCYRKNIDKFLNKKYVSKIVHSETDENENDINQEIKVGKFVQSLDKAGKYFTPILTSCYLKDEIRDNTIQVDDKYIIRNNYPDINSKYKCQINERKQPYNLILRNVGGDIIEALNKPSNSLEHHFLRKNIKLVIKHLCNGMKKLHKNNILHRDIKIDNISFKMDVFGKSAQITLFDFGFGYFLNKNESFDKIYNIVKSGTALLMPPEIVIIRNIVEEIENSNNFLDKFTIIKDRRVIYRVLKNSQQEFHKNKTKEFHISQKLQRGGITNINNFKNKRKATDSHFYIPQDAINIYRNISLLFQKGIFEQELFKQNGILHKWDIYSLGISFLEIIKVIKYYNKDCIDLINNMINVDFTKRYNINMCLRHKYLRSKPSKKPLKKPRRKMNRRK